MRRAGISLLVVVGMLAGRVEAQPALTAPAAPTQVTAKDPKKAKSVASAVALGILPPLLVAGLGVGMVSGGDRDGPGVVLVAGGLTLGPAPGLWYGGHGGGVGMMARGVTLIIAIGAYVRLEEADGDDCSGVTPTCDPDAAYAAYRREVLMLKGILVLSAAAYLTSVVYDVRAAGRVTDRWNRDHGYTVAPAVLSTPTGSSPGLMLTAPF